MKIITMLLGSAILLLIPLILFVFALIGIVIFVLVGRKITKGKASADDDFMRRHNEFMDTSVRTHNNMFR